MNPSIPRENNYQSRVWTGTLRLLKWGIPWVGTCALVRLGPKLLWDKALGFTLLAVGLNIAVGVGLILAHKKYFAGVDELQQKVLFNALAITVGVAVIIGIPWQVMNAYKVISFRADAAHLIALMSLTYVASVVYGNLRYR